MQATRLRTLAPKVRGHIGGSTYELRIVPPLSPRLSAFRTSLAWLLHLALKAGAPEVQSNARQGSDWGNRGNRAGRRRERLGRPAAAFLTSVAHKAVGLGELALNAVRAVESELRRFIVGQVCLPAILVGRQPNRAAFGAQGREFKRRLFPRGTASSFGSALGQLAARSGTRSGAPAGRAVDNPTGAVTHSPPEALP